MKRIFASFLFLVTVAITACAAQTSPYPPTNFPDTSGWGKNIQRTMRERPDTGSEYLSQFEIQAEVSPSKALDTLQHEEVAPQNRFRTTMMLMRSSFD